MFFLTTKLKSYLSGKGKNPFMILITENKLLTSKK